jgi:hypothetical protein
VSQKNLVRKRFKCSEEVPAFSVVAVTAGTGDYRMGFTVAKPTGTDNAYAGTGKSAGTAGLLTMGEDLIVRYTGTIAEGDRCRPKPGDWVMEKNSNGGYVCIGLHEKDSLQVGVFRQDIQKGGLLMFKAPSGGIPGRAGATMGKATCDIVETDSAGQLTTTASTSVIYNWARFPACKNGDRYGVAGLVNSVWIVIAEDCTDDGSTSQPLGMSAEGGSLSDLISFTTIEPMEVGLYAGFIQPTTPTGGTGGGGFGGI